MASQIGDILSEVKDIKSMLSGVEHTVKADAKSVSALEGTVTDGFNEAWGDFASLGKTLDTVHTVVDDTYNEGTTTLEDLGKLTTGQVNILDVAQNTYNQSLAAAKDLDSMQAAMANLAGNLQSSVKAMAKYENEIAGMSANLASLASIKDAIVTGAASFAQMKGFVDTELPKMKDTMDHVVMQSTSVFGDLQSADTLIGSFSRDLADGDSTLKTMLSGLQQGTHTVADLDSALKDGLVDARELASVIVNAKADAVSLAIAIKTSEKAVAGIAATADDISTNGLPQLADAVAQVQGDLKGVVLQTSDIARLAGIAAKALATAPELYDDEQKIIGEMKDTVDTIRRATGSIQAMEEDAKAFMVSVEGSAAEIKTAAGELTKLPGQIIGGIVSLIQPLENIAPLMLLGFGVIAVFEVVNFVK